MDVRSPPKFGPDYRRLWRDRGVLPNSSSQRKALFARDKGVCCKCGASGGPWIYEHIRPLALVVDRCNPDCLKYWTLEWAETRCLKCASEKTAQEATDRAKADRAGKKHRGEWKSKHPVGQKTPEQKARDKASKAAWVERVKAERAARDADQG